MRPISIPPYISQLFNTDPTDSSISSLIKERYGKLSKGEPIVSIVMPAYNEEANILQTLLSLSNNETQWPVEIVVVNNNSKDKTEEMVINAGIPCIRETNQGITNARNAGLAVAKGL